MSNSSAYIYEGVWTNWSYGPILGQTLTVAQRNGGFLLAFLAIYVTVAATSTWQIISFILHQVLATHPDTAVDGLHLQRQATLRNARTAAGAAWELCCLGLSWKGKTKAPLARSAPFGFLAAANLALFAIASIFVSKVATSAGNAVLIRSSDCGYYDFPSATNWRGAFNDYVFKLLRDKTKAAAYAQSCYGVEDRPNECNYFVKRELKSTLTTNVSCPFDKKICVRDGASTIQLESGLIDSFEALGIGAPMQDRVGFRRVSTCTPLRIARYAKIELGPDEGMGRQEMIRLYLGERGDLSNFTYEYYRRSRDVVDNYSIKSVGSHVGTSMSPWTPIAELNRTDADVSVLFLASNKVVSLEPNDDDLFSAHTRANSSTLSDINWPDFAVTAMGCTEQYQFCEVTKSPTPKCTKLTSAKPLFSEAMELFPDAPRRSTAGRLSRIAPKLTMDMVVYGRGSSAIRAAQTVSERLQTAALPNNQWHIEASHWFRNSLAHLQSSIVEYASGAEDLGVTGFIERPLANATARVTMCANQMVREPGTHQNFSVVGMTLVLVLGALLMLVALAIEPVVGWIQQRLRKGKYEYKRMAWMSDAFLQLQRQAYDLERASGESSIGSGIGSAGLELSEWQHVGAIQNQNQKRMRKRAVDVHDQGVHVREMDAADVHVENDPFMMGYEARRRGREG